MVEIVCDCQTVVGYHNKVVDLQIEEVWVDVSVAVVHNLLI